eukprot:745223-Pelagomonas_calceolata.AAC.1
MGCGAQCSPLRMFLSTPKGNPGENCNAASCALPWLDCAVSLPEKLLFQSHLQGRVSMGNVFAAGCGIPS